jgi:hypothetical protein
MRRTTVFRTILRVSVPVCAASLKAESSLIAEAVAAFTEASVRGSGALAGLAFLGILAGGAAGAGAGAAGGSLAGAGAAALAAGAGGAASAMARKGKTPARHATTLRRVLPLARASRLEAGLTSHTCTQRWWLDRE